jgi:hypothetical protein
MVFWHSDDGQRIALLTSETAKYTRLVMLTETGVRLFKVPTDGINLRPALDGGQDYPPRRARAHYRRMGKTWTITGAAERAMKEMQI